MSQDSLRGRVVEPSRGEGVHTLTDGEPVRGSGRGLSVERLTDETIVCSSAVGSVVHVPLLVSTIQYKEEIFENPNVLNGLKHSKKVQGKKKRINNLDI